MTSSDDRALELLHGLLLLCRESARGYAAADRNVPDSSVWRELEPFEHDRLDMVKELSDRIRDLRGDPDLPPAGIGSTLRVSIEFRARGENEPNSAVLAEIERSETIVVEAYKRALAETDIDALTRKLLERQYEQVQTAQSRIRQLLNRAAEAHV